jgi:hypothetical protein
MPADTGNAATFTAALLGHRLANAVHHDEGDEMSPTLKCPKCETYVPDTGMGSSVGGESSRPGERLMSQARQSAMCPSCKSKLVRNPDLPNLDGWRIEDVP